MDIEKFEQLKNGSIGHSLIKAARLHNEYALNRVKEIFGENRFKHSHLALFPHIPLTGITVVELSKDMNISKQAISILVNDLIKMKVLTKKNNPKDKRSSIIQFKGGPHSKLMIGMKGLAELDIEILKILGTKQGLLFKKSLDKVISHYID